MKKTYIISICLLIMLPLWSMAQDKLPVPATPGSWVNDYAGVFSSGEVSALDQKLNEFEYRSSTQIFVITLDDNGG
ncbi:MAG: TPM domain-containing protein, partial [Bacteroidia bacterium]